MGMRTCCCTICLSQTAGLAAAAIDPPILSSTSGFATASSSPEPRYRGTRAGSSGFPPVHHIGMVTRDRDRTLAQLSSSLGFGTPYRFEGMFPDAVLADGSKGFSLRGAFVWMRNTALEIVEPLDDKSPHHQFLKDHGENLHHLAYWVTSVQEEIKIMSNGNGKPKILVDGTGPGNDVPWCYIEGDMIGTAIIELIERNPGSEAFYAEVFKTIGGKIPV